MRDDFTLEEIEAIFLDLPRPIPYMIPDGYIPASVLIPVFKDEGTTSILFTRRTKLVEYHKGEMSFPGGVREDGDEYPIGTALRETDEELGIPSERVRIIGVLSGVKTITDFFIYPVVGIIDTINRMNVNTTEIQEVVSIPLLKLLDKSIYSCHIFERGGKSFQVPFFSLSEGVIWGATGRILKEFLRLLTRSSEI